MEITNIKETVGLFNSFDYIFIIYCLLQIYHGFAQGFRVMLFETVKWLVLIAAIFFSNKLLYPYLLTLDKFSEYSVKINEWGLKSVMSLAPQKDPLQGLIYREVVKGIPYDKIAFFIGIIVIVGILTRMLIMGSLFRKERKGKGAGVLFGIVKSVLVTILVMNVIAGFMMTSNPDGFIQWQRESYILSKTGRVFTGEGFAKYKDEFLEKTYEKLIQDD